MTTPKVTALVDESLAQYIDALDGVGAGVVLYDREDRFVFCNRAYRQSFPERFHHLLTRGVTFETLVRACIDDQYILAAIGNEEAYLSERMRVHRRANDRSVRRFGTGSWLEIREYRTRDGGTVLTRQDVTARKNAEIALAQSQRTLETLMSNLPGMAYRIRIQGEQRRTEFVSEGCRALTGYTPEDIMSQRGNFLRRIVHGEDWPGIVSLCTACLNARAPYQLTYRISTATNEEKWVWEQGRGVFGDDDTLETIEGFIIDVTESHQLAQKLSHQASHDPLTNLLNRRAFEERLNQVLATAADTQSEHALAYIDLDQFKVINDTCGHIAGDELLRQLSVSLATRVGAANSIARLGGDEFGVLMEHCDLGQAECVADQLRRAAEDFRFVWKDNSFSIGVSIGLVPINALSTSVSALLVAADTACTFAKDRGRNRIHRYRPDDREVARRRREMQWVARIKSALEEDRWALYYQPIVAVHDADDPGEHYEFLLRMVDENGELVPPGAFLPAAERYGLATQLDRWALSTALTWLADNPHSLERLYMCAVNLSGHSIVDESFLDFVQARLDETGVPAHKICFEITETAAIANLTAATRFIDALKRQGSYFALDDFGSGLSSFAYLKNLPVDFLKIDGMFVRDIVDDPIDLAMVRSIHEIGRVMGKRTIAEFVENEDILQCLQTIGIDHAQGYALGRPRPLSELTRKGAAKSHIPQS